MEMQQHFVTFYSPGTFVAEETTKPIDSWSVDDAVAMAALITERYNAKPYGFRFTTRGREAGDLDSKQIAASPMHYIGGKIETIEEVFLRNDPSESILRSNMECNGYKRIWTSTQGWRWTQPLQDDDVVLAA
jgi:hypothetical protein